MPTLTDPARELADLCTKLDGQSDERGDAYLARRFNVEPWSAEFYQIIFEIRRRADHLSTLTRAIEIDEDHREEAVQHIEAIKRAFSPDGLNGPWSNAVNRFISAQHVGPIKMLSPAVRQVAASTKIE